MVLARGKEDDAARKAVEGLERGACRGVIYKLIYFPHRLFKILRFLIEYFQQNLNVKVAGYLSQVTVKLPADNINSW